jgi:hypothetical protein
MGALFKRLAQWLGRRRRRVCPHTDWHHVALPPELTQPWEVYWVVCDRCGVVLAAYRLFDSARGLEEPS